MDREWPTIPGTYSITPKPDAQNCVEGFNKIAMNYPDLRTTNSPESLQTNVDEAFKAYDLVCTTLAAYKDSPYKIHYEGEYKTYEDHTNAAHNHLYTARTNYKNYIVGAIVFGELPGDPDDDDAHRAIKARMYELYIITKAALPAVLTAYDACLAAGEPLRISYGECSDTMVAYRTAVETFYRLFRMLEKICEKYIDNYL